MDFLFTNHGSVCLLQPLSEAAGEWVDEHLPEDKQMFGSAVVVEPRYVGPIIDGIINDGLEVRS
jgi:hypothetical protein